MAEVFPSFENIDRLKVKPTGGEEYLLQFLAKNLSDDYEIYFQPFLNGDMPDIIIMRRDYGVIIIEVKDWDLSWYKVDADNRWTVSSKTTHNQMIKSPCHQVFGYKKNLFDLHISGLAEKKVLNENFYNIIDVYVFYYHADWKNIMSFYDVAMKGIQNKVNDVNRRFKYKEIDFIAYDKNKDYCDRKKKQLERDRRMSLTKDRLSSKVKNFLCKPHILFSDEIYYEFRRYLKPPMHVVDQGKDIVYDQKQTRLVKSQQNSFMKIKGVAGSGKTTILAKRAVNAVKRHGDKVLVLTYNKTLRNYIRDKISDVREDFSWGNFAILHYHGFISSQMNQHNIIKKNPENANSKDIELFFDKLYKDLTLFDTCSSKLFRYETVLIDEIQDYSPEWVEMLKKFFLSKNGEMVLFGDESQNIYENDTDQTKSINIRGFGSWERLTRSYRAKRDSQLIVLARDFQEKYLLPKYNIDMLEIGPRQISLKYEQINCRKYIDFGEQSVSEIFNHVVGMVKEKEIHPNDIIVICKNIDFLREIDFKIRQETNQKTMTTFESKEAYDALFNKHLKIVKFKKKYLNEKEIKEIALKEMEGDLESLRSSKKFSFEQNSGHLKLSTIHSFKGIEGYFVVYIATEEDSEELVYTALTRSKKDMTLYIQNSFPYRQFLESHHSIQ